MALTPYGTPYVEGSDFVSGYPAVSQALAEQIDALRRMQPVGMITPYAGELKSADDLAAIDGWLPCDGKAYKRGDFPDLYTRLSPWHVHTGFPPNTPNGTPNTQNFFVPDLRGRSPMGTITAQPGTAIGDKSIALGERDGHQRPPWHTHSMAMGTAAAPGSVNTYVVPQGINPPGGGSVWTYENHKGFGLPHNSGVFENLMPITGVNFIVWTGTTTAGKSPISGVEVAPVTTRQMIQARLEDAGIDEEGLAILRDQLAALRDE